MASNGLVVDPRCDTLRNPALRPGLTGDHAVDATCPPADAVQDLTRQQVGLHDARIHFRLGHVVVHPLFVSE